MKGRRVGPGTWALAGFGGLLVAKMVLLEPVVLPFLGTELVLVASLLPLALLLRGPGVGIIAAACALAHGIHDGGWAAPILTGASAGVATAAALGFLLRRDDAVGWLVAGWILTFAFAGTMALTHGTAPGGLGPSFLGVLGTTWLPINGLGVPLAVLLRRIPARGWGGGRQGVPFGGRSE